MNRCHQKSCCRKDKLEGSRTANWMLMLHEKKMKHTLFLGLMTISKLQSYSLKNHMRMKYRKAFFSLCEWKITAVIYACVTNLDIKWCKKMMARGHVDPLIRKIYPYCNIILRQIMLLVRSTKLQRKVVILAYFWDMWFRYKSAYWKKSFSWALVV